MNINFETVKIGKLKPTDIVISGAVELSNAFERSKNDTLSVVHETMLSVIHDTTLSVVNTQLLSVIHDTMISVVYPEISSETVDLSAFSFEDVTDQFQIIDGEYQLTNGTIAAYNDSSRTDIIPLSALTDMYATFVAYVNIVGINVFDDNDRFLGYIYNANRGMPAAGMRRQFCRRVKLDAEMLSGDVVLASGIKTEDLSSIAKIRLSTFKSGSSIKIEHGTKLMEADDFVNKLYRNQGIVAAQDRVENYAGQFTTKFIAAGEMNLISADGYVVTDPISLSDDRISAFVYSATEKSLSAGKAGAMCTYGVYYSNGKGAFAADYHYDNIGQEYHYDNVVVDVKTIREKAPDATSIRFSSYGDLQLCTVYKTQTADKNIAELDLIDAYRAYEDVDFNVISDYTIISRKVNYVPTTKSIMTDFIPLEKDVVFMYDCATQAQTNRFGLFDTNEGELSILTALYAYPGKIKDVDPDYSVHYQHRNQIFDCNEYIAKYPTAKYVIFASYAVNYDHLTLKVRRAVKSIAAAVDQTNESISALSNLVNEQISSIIDKTAGLSVVNKYTLSTLNNVCFERLEEDMPIISGYHLQARVTPTSGSLITEFLPIEKDSYYMYNAVRNYATGCVGIYKEAPAEYTLDAMSSLIPLSVYPVRSSSDPMYKVSESFVDQVFDCNEILSRFPTAKYVVFSSYGKKGDRSSIRTTYAYPSVPKTVEILSSEILDLSSQLSDIVIGNNRSNVLNQKNYVALGDSFTAPEYSYADQIAQRNNMNFTKLAVGGMMVWWDENRKDEADLSNRTSLNRDGKLLGIKDQLISADYITFQYGINDQSHGCVYGEKTDSAVSSVWGAWNTTLSTILSVNPDVKIGIILPDSGLTQIQHDTQISIAEYWGIPYLDLRDGNNVPMGINGRLTTTVNPYAKSQRNLAFRVSDSDGHPNEAAHTYRSTIIENFIRSL